MTKKNSAIAGVSPNPAAKDNHRERWAEYSTDGWARVQTMLDNGEWVRQTGNHWRITLTEKGKPWKIVVKATSGEELLLSTYHRIQPEPEE
ncbi:MAG: hypothetical protein F4X92_09120 [Gammaproteobacteria bacterium]|nr:hypothetical protein [Gammaproteobacteria bacterium]